MLRSHLLAPMVAAFLIIPSLSFAAANACLTGTCHSAITAIKKQHSAVKGGDCVDCHKQQAPQHPTPGQKGFTLIDQGVKLCANCHEIPGKKKTVHIPVKDGECLFCHRPHGTDNPFLLPVETDRTKLCFECHDGDTFKRKFRHAPVVAGSCNICHAPHESDEPRFLRAPIRDVCFKCHTDFAQGFKNATTVHSPVKASLCVTCHTPHGTDNPFILKATPPELCFQCHQALKDKLAKNTTQHKPVLQQRGCVTCHSPHYSLGKRLLPSAQKDLCLQCHGDDKLAPLKNIRAQITGMPTLHGPVAAGTCTACHDPHGSTNFRMLKGAYPATFYAQYTEGAYALCLGCHQKNLLRYPDTSVYTNFRNGTRNLHFVHVVGANRKGRTCRACHQPHASDGPKLTSTTGTTFGAWQIPVRLQLTATGGSCAAACHPPIKYDRVTPVPYTLFSKPEPPILGAPSSARQGVLGAPSSARQGAQK